jgi:hypothetical protein
MLIEIDYLDQGIHQLKPSERPLVYAHNVVISFVSYVCYPEGIEYE